MRPMTSVINICVYVLCGEYGEYTVFSEKKILFIITGLEGKWIDPKI